MIFLSFTTAVRKLEEKGFVKRERSGSDERSIVITVTENGYKLREKAKDVPSSVGSCLNISVDDATALYGIMKRLMSSFDDQQ